MTSSSLYLTIKGGETIFSPRILSSIPEKWLWRNPPGSNTHLWTNSFFIQRNGTPWPARLICVLKFTSCRTKTGKCAQMKEIWSNITTGPRGNLSLSLTHCVTVFLWGVFVFPYLKKISMCLLDWSTLKIFV